MNGTKQLRAAKWLISQGVKHLGCVLTGVGELSNVSRQARVCGVALI
jgi:hypothetical protein